MDVKLKNIPRLNKSILRFFIGRRYFSLVHTNWLEINSRLGNNKAAVYFIEMAMPANIDNTSKYLIFQIDFEYRRGINKKNNVTKKAMGTSTIAKFAWDFKSGLNQTNTLPRIPK